MDDQTTTLDHTVYLKINAAVTAILQIPAIQDALRAAVVEANKEAVKTIQGEAMAKIAREEIETALEEYDPTEHYRFDDAVDERIEAPDIDDITDKVIENIVEKLKH